MIDIDKNDKEDLKWAILYIAVIALAVLLVGLIVNAASEDAKKHPSDGFPIRPGASDLYKNVTCPDCHWVGNWNNMTKQHNILTDYGYCPNCGKWLVVW